MTHFKTAYSSSTDISSAVSELKSSLAGFSPALLMYFASSSYDQSAMAAALQAAFPGTATFGCSTSGEITSGKMLDNSIVVMGYDEKAAGDFNIQVLENIKTDDAVVDKAATAFESHFGQKMSEMDYTNYIGMVLIDGLSGAEERVMDVIGDLGNVRFIGGSAGDDLKFEATYVYANGKAYTNAAILCLMKPGLKFDHLKSQSFEDTGKTLTVTDSDMASRTIHTFNDRPATEAYAEALGVAEDKLAENYFLQPLGLMSGNEPFVRSPRVVEGKSVAFFCNVMAGMELQVLKGTDIVADTKADVAAKGKEVGGISAIVNFHCILRTLELKQKNLTEEYGAIFKDIPTIGFSTYGEEFLTHVNQTSTMIVFYE